MKADEAVAKYIELRDKKAAMKKAYEEQARKIDDVLKKIEAVFLKKFAESGQESARFPAGTVFKKVRTSDKVFDREAFIAFVRDNEAFDFVENRVNKSALDQYVEETGDLPPGVTRTSEIIVNIRRS